MSQQSKSDLAAAGALTSIFVGIALLPMSGLALIPLVLGVAVMLLLITIASLR